jgi:hypothetical protein
MTDRYTNDPLKQWFDNLTSSNGKCCSFADGFSVSDFDCDTEDGHYRVLLHGEWFNVPNSSVALATPAKVFSFRFVPNHSARTTIESRIRP